MARVAVVLDGGETAPALEIRLADIAADLLAGSLDAWLDGSLAAVPQPDRGATLTRPLRRTDGRLDPTRPAADLERLVRAYLPWPGTYLELDATRLVVTAAGVAPSQPGDVPGRLVRDRDMPALATGDGRLVLESVTPPGRRPMPGADWLRGRREGGRDAG